MENYYIMAIEGKKRGNMEVYKTVLNRICGEMPWSEVKKLPEDSLREIFFEMKREIRIRESNIDIMKLANAIQRSRSGMGGSAMTRYVCHFCRSEEIWINTAVPNICLNCAEDMATNIVMSGFKIEKD